MRVKKRSNGEKVFFFQYWADLSGMEERKRMTEVIGPVSLMTKSEAERRKLEFISKLEIKPVRISFPVLTLLRTQRSIIGRNSAR